MKDRLFDALAASRADYTQILLEEIDYTRFGFRGRDMEDAASGKLTRGMVRTCFRGGWCECVFNAVDDLPRAVAEASAGARLIGRDKTMLADAVPPETRFHPAAFQEDFRGVPLDRKIAIARACNDEMLAGDHIESTETWYSESFRRVHFASSRGVWWEQEIPRQRLAMIALARQGNQVQRGVETITGMTDFSVFRDRTDLARQAAGRAAALLQAPRCESCRTTAILDPKLAGVFIHEAFGHLSEADFMYENPRLNDLMKIGRQVGCPELNVYDDGTIPGLSGSIPVDDEGTPAGRTMLITNGVLTGHLHSLETAAKMGERPTGNARCENASRTPQVRMTNTGIANGSATPDELFAGVDDGVYVCSSYGGETMLENFTFIAGYAYRIRNGRIGELLRDVTLMGNVFETLHAIDGIANDAGCDNIFNGICGKGGQSVPVTASSPHLRIRDVLIGG